MRRAILSFELPEDKSDYDLANLGGEMYDALGQIDNLCRGRLKHCDMSEDAQKLAEEIREIVCESGYHGIN